MRKRELLKIIDDQRHSILVLNAFLDAEREISNDLRAEINRLKNLICTLSFNKNF